MITDKQYLLLCEFADMDIFYIETGSIAEITKSLLMSGEFGQNAVVNELAENLKMSQLKLNSINRFEDITVYFFDDCHSNVFVISTKKGYQNNNKTAECQEELVDFIRSNMGSCKCVVSGYNSGGLHALYTASRLEVEGVLFRVSSSEQLVGNIKNFVPENDPIGEHNEKIIFVKQKSVNENPDVPLSQFLLFDENGNAVIGEQSEYSKFCSWFYNTASKIENDIWCLFFKDTCEDIVFEDKDLYSVFLKINELNSQGIKNSLKNTVKNIENELEKNIKAMKLEFEKNIYNIEGQDFNELICDIAEKTAQHAAEIVKNTYRSIETILMGVGIFALGYNTIDNELLMEQFCENVDNLLDKERHRINGFLIKEKVSYLEMISDFPSIVLNKE